MKLWLSLLLLIALLTSPVLIRGSTEPPAPLGPNAEVIKMGEIVTR